ncbi:IucA/IucC family protein [Tumebacillus permanentifrigoris]|uniref:Siderophore synthetase component n=1 Tax=Tumebacillus permanentifrigoris TaxID=378543 RepID=A0A316DYC1_9BACL|nr:IucA/IucC family protein [Tumebacillus permanentifrigoris]PWK15510.1 siderophore synthetase component [Tumebacillus permanentifrigoris]
MTIALYAEELYEASQRLSRGELDADEVRVLEFLQAEHPARVAEFHAQLPAARASILRRLVESLLREDVLGLLSRARVVREDEKTSLHILLDSLPNEELVIPVGGTFAFRRFEVSGELVHRQGAKVRPLTHAVELLQLLHRLELAEVGDVRHDWGRLARELQNGTANLALALVYAADDAKRLQSMAAQLGVRTSLELVEHVQREQADFDAALFFEQLCVEGHNLHPGAKTKMGMSARDVLAYAPEFGGRPHIRWVAVHRERAGWSYLDDGEAELNAALFAELPRVAESVRREMKRLGLVEQEFLAIPVHPWQYEQVLPDLYRQELAAGVVVPLPYVETVTAATSSFRTVVTEQLPRLAIKVAVNSQMTSTVRSISRHTAYNGPRFTRLIREVMSREPQVAQTFVPLCEVAGLYFEPDAAEPDAELRTLKSRNLTAVWREDVGRHVRVGELAIVGTAYYAQSPVSWRTVLEELVEAYAESLGETNMQQQDLEPGSAPRLQAAARRFLIEYAEIALPGFLTLMVKYGIGLEGHLQNSVGVFRAGRPVRLLFRDWGGVRICQERLAQQGLAVDFAPGSVVLNDDVREMQNKLFYTVYQNHLAEMILLLCKRYELREAELWREIRQISEAVFSDLLACPETQANAVLDRAALFQPQVEHKALTSMRLATEERGYCYAEVANPLHVECRG